MNLIFIDTNVLVYAHSPKEGRKRDIAQGVLRTLWRDMNGVLSTQVLQEFYRVVTRKLKPPMPHAAARARLIDYSEWCPMDTDPHLLVSASALAEDHSVQWYDSLIIEAALRSGATTLLSEDMQDGRRYGRLTVRNPFVESN